MPDRVALLVAIKQTEGELAGYREKCRELEELLAQARALVEPARTRGGGAASRRMTLHRAMQEVLAQHPDGLSAPDLAAEINRRRLYLRRDGGPVDVPQVHARTQAYEDVFTRRDRRILLASAASDPL